MKNLPFYQKLGYLGALPFLLCVLGLMVFDNTFLRSFFILTQMAYGGMILSFLGGVHWAHALPREDYNQMGLAMLPTILGLCLFILPVVLKVYTLSLFGMSIGFLALFIMDKRYLNADWLPNGYIEFRRKITMIVFTCLAVSTGLVVFSG